VVVFLHGDGPGRPALLDVAARLADAVVVDGPDEVREACRTVAARVDAGGGPGRRTEVLGRIRAGVPASAGTGSVAAVRSVRAAGADGCLVGLPFPWEPGAVDALSTSW
jgi:siroheme synthase